MAVVLGFLNPPKIILYSTPVVVYPDVEKASMTFITVGFVD